MGKVSLRLKFILSISLILLLIFGVVGFFLIRNARATLSSNLNRNTIAFSALATQSIGNTYELYKDSGTIRIDQQIEAYTGLDTSIVNAGVVDSTGHTLFSLHPNPAVHVNSAEASSFNPTYRTNSAGQITTVIQPYADANGFHSYAITYSISPDEVNQAIRSQEQSIVTFVILGLLISALITYELLNQLFVRPINKVSRQATTISLGNYDQQIQSDRRDEIGKLADSVNRMANALKADIAQLQAVDTLKNEFITITSHNLRTPLTIIEGNLSLMHSAGLSPELNVQVAAIEESAQRLSDFAEQMLTIAAIEGGSKLNAHDVVTAEKLLAPLIEKFKPLAQAKHIDFKVTLNDAKTEVTANSRQLAMAISNVLDNAVKFTAEGGSVQLETGLKAGHMRITVHDSGIGIKPAEMSKLFTKFHRGTDVLTYDYEGTGIGLYVAKLIVEQHGGTIKADSTEGKGSTFVIELPVATQPVKPSTS